MKHSYLTTLLLSAAVSISCSSLRVETGRPRESEERPQATRVSTDHRYYFLWGLVDGGPVKAYASRCTPDPVRAVSYENTALDIATALLTFGVITSQTVRVECGPPR